MKLYELAIEYRNLVAQLQDVDLPPEVVLDTIDGMQGEVSEKIKAVLIVSMEIESEAEARAAHGKRMTESAKAMANRAEALRSYAQVAIQNCGLALPLKYPEFNVNLQRNPPSCDVTHPELLPPHLKTIEASVTLTGSATVTPDDIAKHLTAAGLGVHGVQLTTKVDKKAVLDTLKTIAAANDAKGKDEEPDRLPGAHFNPTGYRITVK